MANPYPIEIADADSGVVRVAGAATFTDSNNQPGGGAASLLTAEVTLTNAQIKALPITPVELVAAPALGSFICYQFGLVTIDAVAAAYTNIDANASLSFTYNGDDGASLSDTEASGAGLTSLLGGDGEKTIAGFPAATSISGGAPVVTYLDASQAEHLPLTLSIYNAAAGALTGGNAANSGRAKVWYTVETLP